MSSVSECTLLFKSLAHVRFIYSLFSFFFKWLLLLSKAELIWSQVTINIYIAVKHFYLKSIWSFKISIQQENPKEISFYKNTTVFIIDKNKCFLCNKSAY